MGLFEILSHTADVGFTAEAGSLPELYATAAEAMFSLEYDLSTVPGESQTEIVRVTGRDLTGLMEVWLSELIFLHDARGLVPSRFEVTKLDKDEAQLEALIRGEMIGDWFRQSGPQIKAVTLHGMSVECSDQVCTTTVFLDV